MKTCTYFLVDLVHEYTKIGYICIFYTIRLVKFVELIQQSQPLTQLYKTKCK